MSTVKTRILIISDTHCAQLSPRDGASTAPVAPFKAPLPSADVLIHCGDLTMTGKLDQYHRTLDMLKEIDTPVKLVIAGNHDLTLDEDFVQRHLTKNGAQGAWKPPGDTDAEQILREAKDLWTAAYGRARKERVSLLNEGIHDVDLPNGAHIKIYASPYTPEFCDWAFAYAHHEDRFNRAEDSLSDAANIASNPIPSFGSDQGRIDVLITHGPPYGRFDEVRGGQHVGCPHLLNALTRARPLIHCFGHIHEGWGAERVTWSSGVDGISTRSTSTEEWTQTGWQHGVDQDGTGIKRVNVDVEDTETRHGAFVDLSANSGQPLRRGVETLFVNASVMTVRYQPLNAAWMVDVDLDRS